MDIRDLIKKSEDGTITDEEKLALIKMVNASIKEFSALLADLNSTLKNKQEG